MARKHVVARGRVQNVGFRYSAQEAAWRLDLLGWIRNLSDGRRVEIVVEGDDDAVETFVNWCRQGPTHADVQEIVIEDDQGDEPLKPFTILRTQ